jgi:protein-tyrosine-phosphatase
MPAVLFVCTANRIRSPLAEHLFRRQLPLVGEDPHAWRIDSAGTWTRNGLPAMPLAQQAGAEMGLDLSGHRSTPIEDAPLTTYDLIIVMEQGHREAIAIEFPEAAERVYLLSELATGLAYDISDPIGRPLDAYRSAAQEIGRLVDMAMPAIQANS